MRNFIAKWAIMRVNWIISKTHWNETVMLFIWLDEKLGLRSAMPLQGSSAANVRAAAVSRPASSRPAKKSLASKDSS